MPEEPNKKAVYAMVGGLGLALALAALLLAPAGAPGEPAPFEVESGQGFREVAGRLREADLIRSATAFKLFALSTGNALRFKPGTYLLHPGMSSPAIAAALAEGVTREAEVRIPEGASIYLVDQTLSAAGILKEGDLLAYNRTLSFDVEGRLFPDTYRFYRESTPQEVIDRMTGNFESRVRSLLKKGEEGGDLNLILASLIEKEVPDPRDRRIVAGILKKRLAAGMPLQVDASVCYVKQVRAGRHVPCYPLTGTDLKFPSPYNTYVVPGLPPGPIGSPGLGAIEAALDPLVSPYWYYLSDPETGRTIFSRTHEEHVENRAKYLSNQ